MSGLSERGAGGAKTQQRETSEATKTDQKYDMQDAAIRRKKRHDQYRRQPKSTDQAKFTHLLVCYPDVTGVLGYFDGSAWLKYGTGGEAIERDEATMC